MMQANTLFPCVDPDSRILVSLINLFACGSGFTNSYADTDPINLCAELVSLIAIPVQS